jgi:glycerol-3-phosphate dehydrogenase
VKISAEEVRYIRDVAAAIFPHSREIEPIAAYSSLRPLVKSGEQSATKTSREHKIFEEPPGVVRITGGKYTTYRVMSAEAADLAWPELAGTCRTGEVALGGNTPAAYGEVAEQVDVTAARTAIYRSDVAMVTKLFGVQAPAIIERAPKEGASDERALTAVLDWTIEHEMIERMPDFLFVSTYLGHEERWDEALLAHLAEDMGKRLGWDAKRQREEVALTLKIVSMPRG